MTEEEVNLEEEVTEDTMNESDNEGENEEQFLVIRGNYKYGGRNKTYGIFELIGQGEEDRFNYVDIGSSSNDEIYGLFLDLDNEDFRDELASLVEIGNTHDRNISKEIRKNLSVLDIIDLLASGEENEVQELIRERVEDELQEEVELELNWSFLSRDELREIYPERFKIEDEGAGELEEDIESLSDYEGSNEDLDIEKKLNCSPVISAISGKLITSFEVGDEVLVRIADNQDLTAELKNKIRMSNGLGVGTIKEIDYKEGIDRYSVLVELGNKIYGQLSVGPKVMLSYPEQSGDSSGVDTGNETASSTTSDNVGVIVTIVALLSMIIILLLFFL